MKLVVVTQGFWSDEGQANATREVTKELVKLGVELVAVIHTDRCVDHLQEPFPNRSPMSIASESLLLSRPPLKYYSLCARAATSLRFLKQDLDSDCIIHCHNLIPSAFLDTDKNRMKAQFLTTLHGTPNGEVERFARELPVHPRELPYRLAYISTFYVLRYLLKRIKGHVVALSPRNASEFTRIGLAESRIHVIPNGVDLEFLNSYDKTATKKRLDLPPNKPIVSTISEIQPRKGLHTLIRAAHDIVREMPDVHFLVIGRVPSNELWYMSYLRKQLQKFDLTDHFDFRGFVPKSELPLYLNATDLFTLASYSEGAPLVIPAAMASGCMIVATQSAAGGYLPPNLVVENGNHKELGKRISFHLSDLRQCVSIGSQLKQKAINELSWANIAKRTLGVYKELLGA